jgi:hypothetical protein
MAPFHPLAAAIAFIGLSNLARELSVTHQAVRKWQIAGRMPRTEWTGETKYCETIERLTQERDGGPITKVQLLAPWPKAADGAQDLQAPDARPEEPAQRLAKFAQEAG